jgi:hypothetical protein
MTWSLTNITGTAQTGFTSPTYTVSADVAPDSANGKQHAVTALGGTQTGVTVHSVQAPFTLMFYRPKIAQILQAVTGQLSLLGRVPRNSYGLVTRKGVTVLTGQPQQICTIRTVIDIPAGSDTADAANIKAALSAHFGALSQQSAGVGDSVLSNIL